MGAATTRFAIDGKNVVAATASTGETLASWTHAGPSWGGLLAEHRGGATVAFGYDPSSNTRVLTDGAGAVVAQFAYDAFGVERRASGASSATPMRYGGEYGYWRDDAARVYVRARHYAPGAARVCAKLVLRCSYLGALRGDRHRAYPSISSATPPTAMTPASRETDVGAFRKRTAARTRTNSGEADAKALHRPAGVMLSAVT